MTEGRPDGRLVIEPKARPSYSLDELPARCDEIAPSAEGRAWIDAKPIGNELLWRSGAISCSPAPPPYSDGPYGRFEGRRASRKRG